MCEDDNLTFEKNTIFTIVGKNNQNKDYLVYYIVGKFKNYGYKLGVVMGSAYPYLRYFSDNIYIRYDNIVFSNYLKQIKRHNEENLLIVDTEYLNLNTNEWLFFLENHKKYKTTIIFIIDKIKLSNENLLKIYTDYVYLLKPEIENISSNEQKLKYINSFVNMCYNTFGNSLDYDTFIEYYNRTVDKDIMLFILNKKKNSESFYSQVFYKELKEYFFKTKKLYSDVEKYSNICRIGDILKIHRR